MHRLKQLTMWGGDIVIFYVSFFIALLIRQSAVTPDQIAILVGPMSILFFLATVIMFVVGLYDTARIKGTPLYQKIIIAGAIWLIVGVLFFYISPKAASPKTILALTALLSFSTICVWRIIYGRLLSTTIWQTKIIFAGLSPETIELVEFINRQPEYGYRVIGIINAPTEFPPEHWNIPCARRLGELPDTNAGVIVVGPSLENDKTLIKELYQHLFRHTQVENLGAFYEKIMKRVPPFTMSEAWFLANLQEQNKKIYDRLRLLIDCVFAVLLGIFFIITFPFIAIAIKRSSPGPIFFRQIRVGKNNELFSIIKYRTMQVLAADGSAEVSGPQYAAEKDNRITKVGNFLRKTRLDEIPQFINIWRRQMSIIGPRPERPEFVIALSKQMPFYTIRHLVKPGLTGWAQLKHSYYGTIDENLRKLEYDLYYVKNRGFWLDVAIILRTLNVIFGFKGR